MPALDVEVGARYINHTGGCVIRRVCRRLFFMLNTVFAGWKEHLDKTAFEQEDGASQLFGSFQRDFADRNTLLCLNKEKSLSLEIPHDKITIVQNAPLKDHS